MPDLRHEELNAHGPVVSRSLAWERIQANGIMGYDPDFFAVALLICRNCHFVHQFAWRPIEQGGNG